MFNNYLRKLVIKTSAILMCILFSSVAHSEFYLLYDSSNKLIISGQTPPFDISYPPINDEYKESKKRGEHLIIQSVGTDSFNYSPIGLANSSAGQSLDVSGNVLDKRLGSANYVTSPYANNNYSTNERSSYTEHTGPKGGIYHYSASGKKVYKKR